MTKEKFTLPRTKKQSLAFEGRQLAHSPSPAFRRHQANREAQCHWFEASIYETTQGLMVTAIGYRIAGPICRENPQDVVIVSEKLEPMDEIRKVDPMSFVGGYPKEAEFARKQRSLEESIRLDWKLLLDELENQLCRNMKPETIK